MPYTYHCDFCGGDFVSEQGDDDSAAVEEMKQDYGIAIPVGQRASACDDCYRALIARRDAGTLHPGKPS